MALLAFRLVEDGAWVGDIYSSCSGLATDGSWVCHFRALKIGDAARVAPIDKLSVVLVTVFGVAFLGERLTRIN